MAKKHKPIEQTESEPVTEPTPEPVKAAPEVDSERVWAGILGKQAPKSKEN